MVSMFDAADPDSRSANSAGTLGTRSMFVGHGGPHEVIAGLLEPVAHVVMLSRTVLAMPDPVLMATNSTPTVRLSACVGGRSVRQASDPEQGAEHGMRSADQRPWGGRNAHHQPTSMPAAPAW